VGKFPTTYIRTELSVENLPRSSENRKKSDISKVCLYSYAAPGCAFVTTGRQKERTRM